MISEEGSASRTQPQVPIQSETKFSRNPPHDFGAPLDGGHNLHTPASQGATDSHASAHSRGKCNSSPSPAVWTVDTSKAVD